MMCGATESAFAAQVGQAMGPVAAASLLAVNRCAIARTVVFCFRGSLSTITLAREAFHIRLLCSASLSHHSPWCSLLSSSICPNHLHRGSWHAQSKFL